MPKITGYTPPWLLRPSPGSQAFTQLQTGDESPLKLATHSATRPRIEEQKRYYGPHRLLARRGTEIFVVVGNQIRWLDLHAVKSDWEEKEGSHGERSSLDGQQQDEGPTPPYRALVAPVYHQIRQLIVSPSGNYLAILTEHTVHVAVLPDPSHLAVKDRAPLKIKTHQLGPTTHVLPQSPVVAALWHPLACSTTISDCLVTVTVEAAVRVWEIDRNNSWSFDRPSLAIDLQKLADGTSCDQNFEPSGFGTSKGFSVDSFEMEVSAACFGGSGLEEENGWAPMTLWTAMRNGDIYALCPLLPKQWRPTSTLIPSLSTSVVANMACVQDDSVESDDKRAAQQQFDWVQEIDNEEPPLPHADSDPSRPREIRTRPATPSPVPRLQGPFLFNVEENELDLDVSDIYVAPAKINAEDLLSGEEEDYADLEGLIQDRLSITVVCLVTATGKVHVCLDQENVSGQWLPQTGKGAFTVPVGEPKDLLLVESVQLGEAEVTSENRPLFSQDPLAPYDFYVTASNRIDYLSLSSWASRLEAELLSPSPPDAGLEFRIKVLCSEAVLTQQEMIDCAKDHAWKSSQHLSSALVLYEQGMGYFLVACSAAGAHAATFDPPEDGPHTMILARAQTDSSSPSTSRPQFELSSPNPEPATTPPRSAYEPPTVFYESATAPLKNYLSTAISPRRKASLKRDISLSPSTLDIMTAAHRILSLQTSHLEQAAAELFRRCERLQEEMDDQVRQMAELADQIQRSDSPSVEGSNPGTRCEKRIIRAKERQFKLTERYEILRRKIGRATAGGKELSSKEKCWVREINAIGTDHGLDAEMAIDPPETQSTETVQGRYNAVKALAESLLGEAEAIQASQNVDSASPPKSHPTHTSMTASSLLRMSNSGVPSSVQKAKIDEAMLMIKREAAVIEAIMASLDGLNRMQIDH